MTKELKVALFGVIEGWRTLTPDEAREILSYLEVADLTNALLLDERDELMGMLGDGEN